MESSEIGKPDPPPPVTCDICGKTSSSEEGLKVHKWRYHGWNRNGTPKTTEAALTVPLTPEE